MSNFPKIAYGSIGWGTRTMGEIAVELAKIGYDGIEGFGLTELLPGDENLGETLKNEGVKFVGSYFGASLVQPDRLEYETEKFKQTAEAVAKLGGEIIAMGGGRIFPDATDTEKAEHWNSLVGSAQRFGEIANSFGIKLGFHPHNHSMVFHEDEIDQLLERTSPDSVGMTLDIAHLAAAGIDILEALKKYRDRIVHVHLKDFDAESDEFRALGKGELPLGKFLRKLFDSGYTGWLTVELDSTEDPISSAAHSLRVLKNMLN